MTEIDWPALERYWRERRDRAYEEIDHELKAKGIWVSKTLLSDPRAPGPETSR